MKTCLINALRLALLSSGVLALAACSIAQLFPGLPRLSVETRFGTENLCNMGISPKILLSNVPRETTTYLVQITNINVLIQTPWRESVPAHSRTEIPEGAAKNYVGPCIGDITRFAPIDPRGYIHRVEVLAEDAAGRPLAYGSTNVHVESPYVTAKRERTQQQGGPPPPTETGSPFLQNPAPDLGIFR